MTASPISHSDSKLTPIERLTLLCDEGSLHVIRSATSSRRMGAKARLGDGVVGAGGRVEGRPVFCYAQDVGFAGGSVGEAHADTIVRVLRLARQARVPVIGFVESGGARMQEGLAALGGYGRIFYENVALSGRMPQISVITGTSAGGGSYSPALTDFVVMTRDAAMFLTGPGVVREVMGEDTTVDQLGGPRVHERNGVCHFATGADSEAIGTVRQLLGFLPQNAWTPVPLVAPQAPEPGDPGDGVPDDPRRAYDVRDIIRRLIDGGVLVESAPRWARNLVTGFGRIEGRAVGIVANQPKHLAGVLDADAAQKGARFVQTCNTFGIPLVVLVDTPGFMPGTAQEGAGVIRHGAKLLHAFAAATVPRLTVVLRKAFGGAYISMNSKDLGAHLTLAWPNAEIGIMGARQAVGVLHRRHLQEAPDAAEAAEKLAAEYAAEHLNAWAAARDGFIDEVVEPSHTRERLRWALEAMKDQKGGEGASGNIPL